MALSIPSFPSPFDPSNHLANVFAYIAFLALDGSNNTGRLVLNLHPSAAAADAGTPPITQLSVDLGQVLVAGTSTTNADGTPGPFTGQVTFPRLDQLMGDQAFAEAFATIQAKLEAALLAVVPALSQAREVA